MHAAKTLCALLALGAALALTGCGMPASCESQSECPQATVCALGVCRLECPCGDGESCIDGACYTPQCDTGLICAAGSVCVGDTCGSPQCGGQDCGSKVCDPVKQQCVECLDDAQCSGGKVCNPVMQQCVECVENGQCSGAGFSCDGVTGTCVCSPTEAPEESCGDAADNDCDRTVDCADTSCDGRACSGAGTCRQGACCTATTTREVSCSDGIDDDCDGKIDCADENCIDQVCLAEGVCTNAARCLSSGVCAAPTNKPSTTQCRFGGSDVCDPPEFCTGTSPSCPPDRVAAAGFVCRVRQAGQLCDAVETCDGATPTCPQDRPEPAGTLCRVAVPGGCDRADYCDGSSLGCSDALMPQDTVCKTGNYPCDPPDTCSGTSATCAPIVAPAGTACTLDTNRCTADQCNGSGACVTPNVADDTACPGGPAGSVCCDGQNVCIDRSSDSNNCGGCGVQCTGGKECIDGACCEECTDGSLRCWSATC